MTTAKRTIKIAGIIRKCAAMPHIIDRIRYALKKGMKLTQDDANRYPFFTSRLGGFIFNLREAGCPIVTKIIRVQCGDGHIARVGKYSWNGKGSKKK